MSYTLPEPYLTLQGKSRGKLTGQEMVLFDAAQMQAAYYAGRASRDAEVEAIHQAITDPENQPSQFGTVTLDMYEAKEAEVEALRADAERYRWLRDEAEYFEGDTVVCVSTANTCGHAQVIVSCEELDQAIDAARAAQEK